MAHAKLSGSLLLARKDGVPTTAPGQAMSAPSIVSEYRAEHGSVSKQNDEALIQVEPAHLRTSPNKELISSEHLGSAANKRQPENISEVDSPVANRLEGPKPALSAADDNGSLLSDRAAVAAKRSFLASAADKGKRQLSLIIHFGVASCAAMAATAVGAVLLICKRISAAATAIVAVPIIVGGTIGAWSIAGPSIGLPTWLGGSVPELACGTIVNRSGQTVPRRCRIDIKVPDPQDIPTAQCRDGQYSWSKQPYDAETCASHGGVAVFL